MYENRSSSSRSGEMLERLRSSANYIWNLSAHLGKGATGHVYQGMNKHTGQLVAVKAFNQMALARPLELQRREYEVLGKVDHENIVRLLAIEEESETHHRVLIMELCTGGSVFSMLDEPCNSFGLVENEFLRVLKHLTAGMKHLRDLNIIHRDLKPGNIMRHLCEDGQSIYKLTDFGAARELEEDQQFGSMYGTEEYLHPQIYAIAVLRKQAQKSFSAKVDLWSIGVTTFHIATGSLPFRPYGGRKGKEMMHKITTEKQQGIISGIQHSENGDIEWASTLPKTCLLSPSIQEKITPLLAGLLEHNPKYMWTFDQFFKAVTHVLKHEPVYVFFVNNVCDYTFYLQRFEKISNLKARLSSKETAHLPIANQLMIWNKRELSDEDVISDFAVTPDNPIILLNSKTTSIKAVELTTSNQYKFPDILTNISTSNAGQHDAQQSKACASIAYRVQRSVAKCYTHRNLIDLVPQQLLSLIDNNVKLLNEKRESCGHLIESLKDQIEYISGTASNLAKCMGKLEPSSRVEMTIEINELRSAYSETLDRTWRELLPKMLDVSKRADILRERWKAGLYSSQFDKSQARADYLCARIKDSWLYLHKNSSSRCIGPNEIQLHHLEKLRVDTNCKALLKLLYEECHPTIHNISERLEDWYNDAHVVLVQSGCLFDELLRLMKNRDHVVEQLNEAVEAQHQQWQRLVNQLSCITKGQNFSGMNAEMGSPRDLLADEVAAANLDPTEQSPQFMTASNDKIRMLVDSFDCAHNQDHLAEEIQSLRETQRLLCASLSENQNLFSELVSSISARNNAEYTS